MSPRENENNAYANFWGDNERALWYVMVFSGVVNSLLCKGYQGSLCLIRQACETAAKLLLNRQNHILDIHHCKKTEGQVNMILH